MIKRLPHIQFHTEKCRERNLSPGLSLFNDIRHLVEPVFDRVDFDRIDQGIASGGMAIHMWMDGGVAFTLRRLICFAKRNESMGLDEQVNKREVNSYLRNNYSIFDDRESRDRISDLVIASMVAANRSLSTAKKEHVLNWHKNKGVNVCHLCGELVSWDDLASDQYASVDHLWPHSLGGYHELPNLALACRKCNSDRSDLISYWDINVFSAVSRHRPGDASFTEFFKGKIKSAFYVKARLDERDARDGRNLPQLAENSDVTHLPNLITE